MTQENKFRQQANVFLKRIREARKLFDKHLPSIGYAGEHILRQSLHSLLPQTFGICQGFVINEDKLSRQCDIIIYKKNRYAIHKSFGDLKVVNAEYTVSVIEVKSSISKKTFLSTIEAFKQLKDLRVTNCFLFVYGKLTSKSIKNCLFEHKITNTLTEEYIVTDSYLYDWSDKEWLPNAILALGANKYFSLGHLSTYNGNWVGYAALEIKDSNNGQISCLQEFFESITEIVGGKIKPMDIDKYAIGDGIVLFRQ